MVRLIVVAVVGVRFEQSRWCSCMLLRLLSLLLQFLEQHTTGNVTRQTLTHQSIKPLELRRRAKKAASIVYNDAESILRPLAQRKYLFGIGHPK